MGLLLSLMPQRLAQFLDGSDALRTKAYTTESILSVTSRDHVLCLKWFHINSKNGIVDEKCPHSGSTPLHVAAFYDSNKCINFLLSIGCDPNIRDGSGELPLHLAAKSGSVACLRLLMEHKSLHDVRDNWGRTPLLKAIIYNNKKAAHFLLDAGCDPNIQDYTGLSPLHVAANYGQKKLLIELLDAGADIEATNKKGRTPLCSAVNGSHFGMVLTLLKSGAKTTYNNRTIVKDAFVKLVNSNPEDSNLCMRITSLVLSAHGHFLSVEEWDDADLIGTRIDVSQCMAILRKLGVCFDGNVQSSNGIFRFKQFFAEKPSVLSLEGLSRNLLRRGLMETEKNVVWACDRLDVNPILKDIILIKNILNF